MKMVMGGFGRPGATPSACGPPPTRRSATRSDCGAGFLWARLALHRLPAPLVRRGRERLGRAGELRAGARRRRRLGGRGRHLLCSRCASSTAAIAQMIGTRQAQFGSGAAVEIYGSEGTHRPAAARRQPAGARHVLGAQTGDGEAEELDDPRSACSPSQTTATTG